jgi:hypothetical protein
MNRLQLPHAKLFYMISEMYKKNLITDDEKRILKCMYMVMQKKLFLMIYKSFRSLINMKGQRMSSSWVIILSIW